MEWPALLVPVWLGGMETYAIIIPMTAVLTHASMAHVRYYSSKMNYMHSNKIHNNCRMNSIRSAVYVNRVMKEFIVGSTSMTVIPSLVKMEEHVW
jgi:hypothetical protein